MTGPSRPGPPGPPTPPDTPRAADEKAATPDPPEWFQKVQQQQVERERIERARVERERAQRAQAQLAQAQRAQLEREQAQRQAMARANSTRYGAALGREVRGPVRQNETPWIGAPPGAMFPAAEDATMLIQRITDEAVPRDVREAATVMHYPAEIGPRTGEPAEPPTQKLDRNAASGMKTASTAGVVRAGALMAIATVVSRVTGLLSKIAILAILGVNFTSTAYTVANTLPNIVFELLIGGVLTSVAIPLLTRAQRSDPDGGLEYTQRLLTIAIVGLAGATVVAVACAPLLTRLYVHSGSAQLTGLTTDLSRFLLPQMFFYGLAALFGAILNTKERFTANAWAPVLNNVVVIGVAVVLWLANFQKGQMTSAEMLILGIGTTLGIVLQAVVMIPALRRSGFHFKWRWGWDRRLTEAGGLVGWAIVYVLISQVGVVVTTNVAVKHNAGGPTTFSYASLLFQMPYGILGVAVLTAIMPRLSRHAAAGQMDDVKKDVSLANRLSAVALFPVSAAFVVLGAPVAVALFNWRSVKLDDAQQMGLTLAAMAIGLVPLAMTLVQMRVFYAMKDGRTPTLINAIMVAVRVPLLLASSLLSPKWAIPGLAMATAVSYIVGAVVGEIWLRARFGRMGTTRTLRTIGKMLVSSVIGGAAAYLVVDATIGITPKNVGNAIVIVVLGGVVGLLTIAVMTTLLRVDELAPVRNRVLRLLGRPPSGSGPDPRSGGPSAAVTAVSPGAMAGSARPMARMPGRPAGPTSQSPSGSMREQVTERVTQAGAGGPRDTPDEPTSVVPTPVPTVAPGHDRTVNLGGTSQPPRPPVTLAPGATVGGRYRLVSLVAVDDAGNRFWRAKDTVLPRDMAVTLLPDTNATSATVARTLRVGRLHHIGLPQTLDVGTEQGQSYVVGQWVDGATLTDLLAGGPLEPDVATSITAKVSEAVAEAHRNGIALGAINPSLVRVNFDGQVRLSHVIAHGNATPDQDIRAVGGLLYLMLTGTWPIPADPTGTSGDADGTVRLGPAAPIHLPPAPTRLGREVPAAEVRSTVPEALSALAERALHPDDPAGIHAVGAIAALLRQPEAGSPAPVAPAAEPPRSALNPAERRLVKERRVKLGIASLMIAAFSALIIIIVASLTKQLATSIAGPTVTNVQKLTSAPTTSATKTAGTKASTKAGRPAATSGTKTGSSSTSPSPSTSAAGVVQVITSATAWDPEGSPPHESSNRAPFVYDKNPQTFWDTFQYNQQFPTVKHGVGLVLQFGSAITPTSVTVTSDTPSTTIEIRSTTSPTAAYTDTKALGQGTISSGSNAAPGSVTINLTGAPKSQYLAVYVTQLAPDGGKFRSDINEVSVSGTP
ncbi:putative peptidoglycan lipid II flippase [Nakamurella panacisegetis]|uniref:Putative peptidoglycan lipid II flippase n=1 Tax=Nakamurella panacisegetis TaxID=1090615 RepID=A0A1H0LWQ5_9ACTN|nr:murein biosynthesis integral membrane protein MurJ [Nakamurella panacisegetis]SDO72426.1 putative peptidoglycan lipid II flippase [Nakamurella panacisegetis]